MKGYMTYFFEQHKRLILGYSLILVIAMIVSLSLKTTTAPAAVTIIYVSVFASLAPIATLNSDREIDQLLSLPGGRRNLVTAHYINAVISILASFVFAAVVTLLTILIGGSSVELPSLPALCHVLALTMLIVAIMQPLSMLFGRKGLLIGFAALMLILFQTAVRLLLTYGGALITKYVRMWFSGEQTVGILAFVGDGVKVPDISRPVFLIISAGTAISAFVSSFIICRLVFARKNFRVNKL